MLDGVTLNQLRAFVAVCDEASFSEASRKLQRAQSAVSHAVGALEETLNVVLFERTGRRPELTAAGRSLLADARAVIGRTEELKTRARSIAKLGAPDLSLAVDPYFPRARLLAALVALRDHAPTLQMRLFSTGLTGAEELVLEGRCDMALVADTAPAANSERIHRRHVCEARFITVCAPSHPLGLADAPIDAPEFERHTQLVVTDHDEASSGERNGVAGERNWLLSDLASKRDFLVAGLGWGHMPEDHVAGDLAAGRLVAVTATATMGRGVVVSFVCATLRGHEPSATEAWLVARLADSDDAVGVTRVAGR